MSDEKTVSFDAGLKALARLAAQLGEDAALDLFNSDSCRLTSDANGPVLEIDVPEDLWETIEGALA